MVHKKVLIQKSFSLNYLFSNYIINVFIKVKICQTRTLEIGTL